MIAISHITAGSFSVDYELSPLSCEIDFFSIYTNQCLLFYLFFSFDLIYKRIKNISLNDQDVFIKNLE